MKTFVKKNWKRVFVVVIIGIVMYRIIGGFFAPAPVVIKPAESVVEVFTLGDISGGDIDISCRVEPISEIAITAEDSGAVTKVFVVEGQEVQEGNTLFEIENIQQRVAVADANVALESAQLALKDLQGQNDTTSNNSLLTQTQAQQDALVSDALNNLFNTDLLAYPEDNPEKSYRGGPTILGNYACAEEGEYVIEVYSSDRPSGASFRYSGIESGTSPASTTGYGTTFGNCGLELVFPEDLNKNEAWIIPIPNTRSSSYQEVKIAYETALSNRDVTLNKTEVSPEAVSQSEGRVNQAQLVYQLALDNLSKTIIKAKISGTISGFDMDAGEYVSAFSELGNIKTVNSLEVIGYINASEQRYVSKDSKVQIADTYTSIKNISKTIDSVTRKLKLVINAPEDVSLSEGLSLPCSVERITDGVQRLDGGAVVPLSAVSILGVSPFVFVLDENNTTSSVAVTVGAILGQDVVVYGLGSGVIIKDARGIRDQQEVNVTEI